VTRINENQIPQMINSENQDQSKQTDYSRERWWLFAVTGLVLILDILSKEIIRNNLPIYTYWAPFPALEQFFRFTHTSNTGVAFGLFQNANVIFAIFASIVSIGIIYFNQKLDAGNVLLRIALGLQLGGALGNLIDRILFGSVTDFLDFGPWPIFNIADTAVVAGVLLMGFVVLQEERNEKVSKSEDEQDSAITSLKNPGSDESTTS
jgi:signal peptidase II